MHSNPQSPPNPSNTHNNNKEDPFSFEFYLNQSPEQKQEQTTNYSHHHHHLYNREQHHQSIQSHSHSHSQSYSPEHSQSSSTSLSPIQDEESNDQDLSLNLNDQDFTSSYSSTLDEPFSTVPLSRSSSVHAFSTNSLGLQSEEMSLSMDQSNHGNNNGGGGFSSVKMTHSDSAPAFSFINPQLDRRDSFLSNCSSSPSASSTLSLANSYSSSYNGNQQHFRRSNAVNYNNGGGSVSPASYISHPSLSLPSPCPSPLGLPTALSSISGLAIIDGGNGNGSTSNSSASSPQSQANHLNNHQQLMALSSDGENGKHQNMGMPLDLNLGMGIMDGGNGNDGQWNGNERWWNNNNSNRRSSPNSARPTLGNALGLNSAIDQDGGEDMDQDEEEEEEDDEQDGQQPSKRRAPPGVNDMEEALPSPARSTAASRKDSSPAFRATRPLGIILKRRATSSNVNEITPVALSRPSFAGQTSTAASDLVRHRHSISNTSHPQQFAPSHQHHHHPQTPRNDTVPINSLNSAISMSSTPGMQTPASSHSVTATPDYSTLSLSTPSSAMKRSSSYHLGGSSYTQQSDFESPSQSMMPPRLQRGQSYSGLAMGMSKCQDLNEGMDLPVGLPAHLQFGRNLERVMNDGSNEEHGLGIAGNGMVPLSPFRSPQSRPAMTRNFTTSSVPQDPPHSAGYPSAAFSMAHLAAESPAKMQRSQSLGMGAPQSLPSSAYSTSGSSDGLSFSPAASSRGLPSSLGYPFTYGASVPSTPNGPTNDINSSSYYTAPTPSMKLTLSKGNPSRRKAAPPPLVVSSTGKSHACHCGKRFRRAEHLKRHQRAHTEEKPHHCVLHGCGKAFGRSDNLAQHLKTHFKHVALSKEDLKRLMDDSKILVTSGKASTLANTLESQEKEAAKFAPPVPSKKRNMSKKRNVDGDVKEPSKKAGASKKNNTNKNDEETQVATWSANDSHHQSPQRQALSPTGSAVANSPPDFLQNSNLSLYSN